MNQERLSKYVIEYRCISYHEYGQSVWWHTMLYAGKLKTITTIAEDGTETLKFYVLRRAYKLPFVNVWFGTKWVSLEDCRIWYCDVTETVSDVSEDGMKMWLMENKIDGKHDSKCYVPPPTAE